MSSFPMRPKLALALSGIVLLSIPVSASAEGREEFDKKDTQNAAIFEAQVAASAGVISHANIKKIDGKRGAYAVRVGVPAGVVAAVSAALMGRNIYNLWEHSYGAPENPTEPSASVVSQKGPAKRAPAYVPGQGEQLPVSPANGCDDRGHDVK